MMRRVIYILGILLLMGSCTKPVLNDTDYVRWVDPYIGSDGHGHVFVGASVPHGMVQLGPNNQTKGWDWCSGYHYSDSTIVGFAHTHLSGTGIADLGDILFQPVTGIPGSQSGIFPEGYAGYVSSFRRSSETVEPGYYSVLLDRFGIQAELTATERAGFHRYTYPSGDTASVVIDLDESAISLNRQGTLESGFTRLDPFTIEGYRISNEWANDHRVYFHTRFSQPIQSFRIYRAGIPVSGDSAKGKDLRIVLTFGNELKEPLLAKSGISYVDHRGAQKNLEMEIPDWDFDSVRKVALQKWNSSLSKIEFNHPDTATMRIFYTALFHTQIFPAVFNDVDGRYRGADGEIYFTGEWVPHTVFSLWDTYRAVHPLYTLVDSSNTHYVNSLLAIYEQQKRLPVWHLVGNETDCMVGVHSIPVIAEAVIKGTKGVNPQKALEAVRSFARMDYRGLKQKRELGYIPADEELWSVAKALEYTVDDAAIAALAAHLGDTLTAEAHRERSKYYTHYFNKETGFMRGKMADGSWRTPFDPFKSIHLADDYVEGNGWQYTWLVPHDVPGLVQLFGGEKPFVQKLDSLFLVSSELNEGASIDITGMIGQYAHGNEPGHHTLYLYPYVGQPWKTAEKVHHVFREFYKDQPDGLIGNEDCGQMSAWYIFSSLGFYPVNPVDGLYVFGSPLAHQATLRLINGRTFSVKCKNQSKENIYIQRVTFNGQEYTKAYIRHEDIMDGGELTFYMGAEPNPSFGTEANDRPN